MSSFAHTLAPANVQAQQAKSAGGSVCSVCGRTEKEFLSSGIVGCADCYRELAVVKKAIVKMQGVEEDERHRGKSGTGQEKLAELVFRRNEIKAELEKMIAKKDLKGVNRCREEMQNLNALIYNEEE
ncbi:MAG: hypothetical protein IJV80_05055 [Clostridia bacterium]|nr:hypothetical protein [Clostridia bacterium]